MKRQVDWMVNSSLTGPICSRALKQLTQLEIFPARKKIGRLMSVIEMFRQFTFSIDSLAQFNNLSLNFVTFREHSAQKLSKTIRTDPCGVLNVNELKRENVLIRASYCALPISHLKSRTLFGHRKTPKPWSVFGADFAVHYRRYGLRLAAF